MSVPRLHPSTIEEVKQRADIVDVVSDRVVLKKQGKDFAGLCPFHDDKSPSFTVSPSKQFYYCFSCGAGGNAIKFLMELDKRSFGDVVLDLARRYQVPVQTLEPEQRQELQRQLTEREQLYEILALAARFYEHALMQPQGQHALAYLTETRGFDRETIQQFQLGYAPGGWDVLLDYLVQQKQYPLELVAKAGLILPRKSGGGHYDRFRDRLMVPIADDRGRVVGFGGRVLGDGQPKYLNSPETELFDKGRLLFGLDKAKRAIARDDSALVVEGYFDAIALHAAGIDNAVAALGTALSTAQVRQLLRYTDSKEIVLNFDADGAGQRATERAIGEVEALAYRGDVRLRVLNLPDGKDADEFLRSRGVAPYRRLLADAPLWLDWQLDRALGDRDLRQADQFQSAVKAAVQLLGNLPNAALRSHYIRQCAERLADRDGRYALQLERDLRAQVKGQRWHGQSNRWQRPADTSLREAAEADLLRVYLHCPDRRQQILAVLEERELEFGLSHHRLLWRSIWRLQDAAIAAQGRGESGFGKPNSGELHPGKFNPGESDSGESDSGEPLPVAVLETLELPLALQSLPDLSAEALQPLRSLLNPDEKARLDLARPELTVRAAVAGLESLACAKRCRHLLDTWLGHYLTYEVLRERQRRRAAGESDDRVVDLEARRQQRAAGESAGASPGSPSGALSVRANLALADPMPRADPDPEPEPDLEAALQRAERQEQRYRDLYYQERHYLQQLRQQRCTSFDDLTRHPIAAIAEFPDGGAI